MHKNGFSTQKYLKIQTKQILDRVSKFDRKLYLEFGGKLCTDHHAERVLPGYEPDAKLQLLRMLKSKLDIIYCISARDIQKGRIRYDYGLTYEDQTLKDIEDMENFGLPSCSVVITFYNEEEGVLRLKRKLERDNKKVYFHKIIKNYPVDLEKIVSDKGYGMQPYIKTSKPIVVVTGTGPSSGKMATCLSQMYHDNRKKDIRSGYAKFETFPIWNLSVDHPVNVAYEAATADIGDFNAIDPFHHKAHNLTSVNYNRDIDAFPILQKIITNVVSNDNYVTSYKSPTDMGVNMAKEGIVNDDVVRKSACQEILRRYFRYAENEALGLEKEETVHRMEKIMEKVGITSDDRKVVNPARQASKDAKSRSKGHKGVYCGAAIELPGGKIISGYNSPMFHAESTVLLRALKALAGIPENIDLLTDETVINIGKMKKQVYGEDSESLNLDQTLTALAISAHFSKHAKKALSVLTKLTNCEMHVTHIPTVGDKEGLRKLKLHVTTDALPFGKIFRLD